MVYPIVLGMGKRLFRAGRKMMLRLLDTRTFSSDVVSIM
ncbi:hypothetical protein SBF1_7980006 [Candidatus Desulfosporosinus infrequens]|uniref:Uncharacterized protein n=1 Tax=Candidatus Desulfosporosinus infrequens TaxID=2043169 RepID=A0A2U3LS73_9FIRM|nr:hypothetical protein SBF1_7980006 [Candidatus Desulfosporosinus infrequens]